LRFEETLDPDAIRMIHRSLRQGRIRADSLLAGKAPWTREKGRLLRGFRSTIDGSTQPYGVVVPVDYNGSKPMRLDVVLHGSLSRWHGSGEIRFENWFKPNEAGGEATNDDYIEIYPLGRVENGYRWAGEADIFEAIDAVSRSYGGSVWTCLLPTLHARGPMASVSIQREQGMGSRHGDATRPCFDF